MTFHLRPFFILSFLLVFHLTGIAQTAILISDSLASNADMLKVKMGTQWMGKIWKFRFGDYSVVSSKMGWRTTRTHSDLLSTKTDVSSSEKFSFVLANKSDDSAVVNAASNTQLQSLHELEIFKHLSVGSNELLLASQNFTAFITINIDTADAWALFMNLTEGSRVDQQSENFLTNGQRTIYLQPISSEKSMVKQRNKWVSTIADTRTFPAVGFELIENGKSLSAVQYYGGGISGSNSNIIWLGKSLDDKTRLVLAAAMTAVMQQKAGQSPTP